MSSDPKIPRYSVDLEDFAIDLRRSVFKSQIKAAEALPVHRTTISKYERGKLRPSLGYLACLANMLFEKLTRGGANPLDLQLRILTQINKAIHSRHYPYEKRFTDWDELVQAAEDFIAERESDTTSLQSVIQDLTAQSVDSRPILAVEIEKPIQLEVQNMPRPGSAPPTPSLIVGRKDDLQKLKGRLGIQSTHEPEHPVQILTAIRGWPGVGKTTIASALAYDPDISAAFPDGVLWVSLGQEPNLMSEIAAWGRALGTDELLRALSLEEASAQLRALLRHRTALLIIDDVWESEHAVPFNVGGRACATIITTRLRNVADDLAPTPENVYLLSVLSDDESLELLSKLSPEVIAQYPDEALELAKELEGLPLALQVAGRLLNTEAGYGFGVRDLIVELHEGAKLLEAKAPPDRTDIANQTTPTIAALLQTSVERLDQETQDCYAYLGVFAPKPATFDLKAMKSVWQVDDPKPFARTLVDRGLLEYVHELERYQMHAVLVMHAKTLLT